MERDPRILGIVLAAGAGRRYGKPKVLVDGWLDTAVTALRDGGCDRVTVVLGAATVPVPDGAVAVVAPDWNAGLSASVGAGLDYAERLGADYVVLHVVDTPGVGAAVVRRVLERALTSGSGLARAEFAGEPGHPVVIARRHWPALRGTLSGDRGAGPFLRAADDVDTVECGDLADGRDYDYQAGGRDYPANVEP